MSMCVWMCVCVGVWVCEWVGWWVGGWVGVCVCIHTTNDTSKSEIEIITCHSFKVNTSSMQRCLIAHRFNLCATKTRGDTYI